MIAEAVISRELLFASGVADARQVDAFDTPKLGVWSPESAKGKRRGLEILWNGTVDGWRGLCTHDSILRLMLAGDLIAWTVDRN